MTQLKIRDEHFVDYELRGKIDFRPQDYRVMDQNANVFCSLVGYLKLVHLSFQKLKYLNFKHTYCVRYVSDRLWLDLGMPSIA